MTNGNFNISLIIIILAVPLNLYTAQEMQMKLGGASYFLSCQDRGSQGVQKHIFKPQVLEGKLIVPFDEGRREISVQFFKDRIPEVGGNTKDDCIVMIRDGKIVYTNNQAQLKKMSESLDENDNEQKFQLDGAVLFVGDQKMHDNAIQESLLRRLKNGQKAETILREEKHLKCSVRFDKAIELVPTKEGIESFLQEESLPENIDNAVKQKLLRTTPGFYESFMVQESRFIGEELLHRNGKIVVKEYWNDLYNSTIELYDLEKKETIKEFRDVSEVLGLNDHIVAIKYSDSAVELYDIEANETIEKFEKVHKVEPMNPIAVIYFSNYVPESGELERYIVKLYDLEKKETIIEFENVGKMDLVGNHTLKIRYRNINGLWLNDVKLYDFKKREAMEGKGFYPILRWNKYEVTMNFSDKIAKICDIKKKETIEEYQDVFKVFLLNDDTVVIAYEGNIVELYDIEKKDTIEKFQNVLTAFKLNDHQVVIGHRDQIVVYDIEEKRILWEKKDYNFERNFYFLGRELVAIRYKKTVEVVNWKTGKRVYTFRGALKPYRAPEDNDDPSPEDIFKVRKNNVWIMDNGTLKRFGPDLSFEKLNSKKLYEQQQNTETILSRPNTLLYTGVFTFLCLGLIVIIYKLQQMGKNAIFN